MNKLKIEPIVDPPCRVCGNKVEIMINRGSGICSQKCGKVAGEAAAATSPEAEAVVADKLKRKPRKKKS